MSELDRDPIEPCRRCGGHLEGDGWCLTCARKRQKIWEWGLILVAPPIGFVACMTGGGERFRDFAGFFVIGGCAAVVFAPILGIYVHFSNFDRNLRRKK